jgi:hypothetical protein
MEKIKILWFSRHEMSASQHQALVDKLGEIEVCQVSGSPANVHVSFTDTVSGTEKAPLKELVQGFDVVAVVLPVNMLQQLLQFTGDKPVIQALNKRVLVPQKDGIVDKVEFVFDGWQQVHEIRIVTSKF